jgi:AcrR family transcriptional regulator
METRQRVYEAAMAEYTRVGVDAARVEDIVAAAGVSWGTFFHYFPAKEDVLLDAAVVVCRAFAAAAANGLEAGHDTAMIFGDAFAALFRSAREVAEPLALRRAVLRHAGSHPGRLSAVLDEETPSPVQAAAEVIAEGQRRGEVRADQPAESLAVVLCYSVLSAARRVATLGRPPDSPPLSQLALQVVLRGMRPSDSAPAPPTAGTSPGQADPAGQPVTNVQATQERSPLALLPIVRAANPDGAR